MNIVSQILENDNKNYSLNKFFKKNVELLARVKDNV